MGEALAEAAEGRALSLVRVPLGWHAGAFDFRHPLDYLGYDGAGGIGSGPGQAVGAAQARSEEHTSELQSLMRISYAVFCLKKKKIRTEQTNPDVYTLRI